MNKFYTYILTKMETYKDYNHVIIVDKELGVPVAWGGEQLCFCTNQDWQDEVFPVKIYLKRTAHKYIIATTTFRKRNGWDVPEFDLYPIAKKSK